jgi:hypothetical protein
MLLRTHTNVSPATPLPHGVAVHAGFVNKDQLLGTVVGTNKEHVLFSKLLVPLNSLAGHLPELEVRTG